MRAANAHLIALVEGDRPEKIAERSWPNERDVGLLIRGRVSTMTTTSAPALMQLTQSFVASLSPEMREDATDLAGLVREIEKPLPTLPLDATERELALMFLLCRLEIERFGC